MQDEYLTEKIKNILSVMNLIEELQRLFKEGFRWNRMILLSGKCYNIAKGEKIYSKYNVKCSHKVIQIKFNKLTRKVYFKKLFNTKKWMKKLITVGMIKLLKAEDYNDLNSLKT